MIREDAIDLSEHFVEDDDEEDMQVQSEADILLRGVRRHQFSETPQISVTDTHGHVTDMTSSTIKNDDKRSEKTVETSTVPTTLADARTFQEMNPSPTSAAMPSAFLFGNYIDTNLANIPHQMNGGNGETSSDQDVSDMGAFDQTLPMMGWFNAQIYNAANRYPRIGQGRYRRHHTIQDSGDTFAALHYPLVHNTHTGSFDSPYAKAGNSTNEYVPDEPRELFRLIPQRNVDDILNEIKKTLDSMQPPLAYEHAEKRFVLENFGVQMEMKVCEGDNVHELQMRRISGDSFHYEKLCHDLLAGMNL